MARDDYRDDIGEIEYLIDRGDLKEAARAADRINWAHTGTTAMLCRVSDVYKACGRYEESRDLLQIALERNPNGLKIIYSLCELELKMGNLLQAIRLYNRFEKLAPEDPDRYVLQYKIYKTQDVGIDERIEVLEALEKSDIREKWSYELAKLYAKADRIQECIDECDEIVAFFGDGPYVMKALELKSKYKELTDQEKERYIFIAQGGKLMPDEPEESDETPEERPEHSAEKFTEYDIGPEEESPEVGKPRGRARQGSGRDYGEESDSVRSRDAGQPEEETVFPDTVENVSESEYRREMEKTVAEGMQELNDYDSVLTQETDGQYTMVMQEASIPETQITGQLDFNEIMQEWEKIRRDNEEAQRKAEQDAAEKAAAEQAQAVDAVPANEVGRAIREGFEEYVEAQPLSKEQELADTKEIDTKAINHAIKQGDNTT